MKLVPIAVTSFATLLFAGILVEAAQDKKPPEKREPEKASQEKKEAEKKEVVFVSSEDAKYKEIVPGASMAVISGDPDKGAHRMFTKFAPGATFALHTHPSEMSIVVLKGAYIYKPEKGEERRVGPGGYLHFPAGDRHVSSGDAKEGALFFEESTGKFGVDFVDKEKK